MAGQAQELDGERAPPRLRLAANAAVIGLGAFANLAFEATGLDLPVVTLVVNLAAWMSMPSFWRRRGSTRR
jgi:hypothetical protein